MLDKCVFVIYYYLNNTKQNKNPFLNGGEMVSPEEYFNNDLRNQRENGANNNSENRLRRLETSVSILFGLFIGHFIGEIICGLLQLS